MQLFAKEDNFGRLKIASLVVETPEMEATTKGKNLFFPLRIASVRSEANISMIELFPSKVYLYSIMLITTLVIFY